MLVFIHGGYWQRNTREFFADHGRGRARARLDRRDARLYAGARGDADADRRGNPRSRWIGSPAKAPAHGAGGPAIVTGWSAGAHLAAMALDHPHVRAGVGISGVYELGPIRDTDLNAALKLSDEEIATAFAVAAAAVAKAVRRSPTAAAELPALVEDARQFHALRAAAHAPGWLLPIAGANHFTVLDALREPKGEILAAILALADTRGMSVAMMGAAA